MLFNWTSCSVENHFKRILVRKKLAVKEKWKMAVKTLEIVTSYNYVFGCGVDCWLYFEKESLGKT